MLRRYIDAKLSDTELIDVITSLETLGHEIDEESERAKKNSVNVGNYNKRALQEKE